MKKVGSSYPKSKRYIRKAFLELLEEHSYQEITVTDIVEKSELGRTTFYIYYKDKQFLYDEITRDLADGLISLMKKTVEDGVDDFLVKILQGSHPIFFEYFEYFRLHSYEIKTLNKPDNGLNFKELFSDYVLDYRMKTYYDWVGHVKNDGWKMSSYQPLMVSSFVSSFFIWLDNNMEPSVEVMVKNLALYWKFYIEISQNSDADGLYRRMIELEKQMNSKKI